MEAKEEALGVAASTPQGQRQENNQVVPPVTPDRVASNEEERNNCSPQAPEIPIPGHDRFEVREDGVYYLEYDKKTV